MRIKSTLLLLTVLLFYTSAQIYLERILFAFVSGCTVASIFCLAKAAIAYLISGDSNVFLYSEFSFFIHPGYFSMYLVFSSLIIVLQNSFVAKQKGLKLYAVFIGGVLLLHYLMIGLLESRANFLSLGILSLVILYY